MNSYFSPSLFYPSILSLFVTSSAMGQNPKVSKQQKKADNITTSNLRKHIAVLAADSLEGRRTGSIGEQKAVNYILQQYASMGLPAAIQGNYVQAFEINEGKQPDDKTSFSIDDTKLDKADYFPLPWSASLPVKASTSVALQESGEPWWYDVKDDLESNTDNPHFSMAEHLKKTAASSAKKGATALLVYNSSEKDDSLAFNGKDKSDAVSIPVIYFNKNCIKKLKLSAQSAPYVEGAVAFSTKKRLAHNVAAYLDNGAATTVVIGAHLDHLGYGEDENSRHTGEAAIHNGADDNASGTAAVLELARLLQEQTGKKAKKTDAAVLRKHNYLFVHFSGEELGLYGSKYFVEHPSTELSKLAYMVNLDMVGRLNDSSSLTVGGVGTSPGWPGILQAANTNGLQLKYDSSGAGPSDHTSFYRKDIPVLFFFTGLHTDYHQPTDDADKINYDGETQVINYILNVLSNAGQQDKLAFTKTKEASMGTGKFKVSIGIMPDYAFSGKGVRADGVIDDRPAKKAGVKTGDIITKLGQHTVTDMQSYMQALNQFEKGQSTTVTIQRGNEVKELSLTF